MLNLATVSKPARQRRKRFDDAPFVAALDYDFRNAPMIARHMLANGTPASLASIRERMAEFVRETDDVEAKDNSWRITPPTIPTDPANDNDIAAPLALDTIHHGDCLELMKSIPDHSVNLICCDPPFGTCGAVSKAGHPIDIPLDLEKLWKEYRRIIAPGGNIVLFGSQPFSTDLINSARDLYKYTNIWHKDKPTGFDHARNKPLKDYEEILVFSPSNVAHARKAGKRRSGTTTDRATFNPWKAREVEKVNNPRRNARARYTKHMKAYSGKHTYMGLEGCPRMVMGYNKERGRGQHPYQKPLALLDDLIRMYSNASEVVLDNCAGSGSTAIAAIGAGRRWIAIEQAQDVYEAAKARIDKVRPAPPTPANDDQPFEEQTTLLQGDCLEVMRKMESGSIDLIVTSPPYNLRTSTGGGMKSASGKWAAMKLKGGYASYSDDMKYEDYVAWQRECVSEMWRLIPEDGAIFYNHKPRVQAGVLQTPLALIPDECIIRQIVTWDRTSGHNFNRSFFVPRSEWIVILAKPKWRLLDRNISKLGDVWQMGYERDNDHPAPFPLELPRRAIAATSAKTVLDPFSGSGTTGVAAKLEGRRFVGIELDAGYLEKSRARIAAA